MKKSLILLFLLVMNSTDASELRNEKQHLKMRWERNILTISGDHLSGGEITINYLEAYCRAGSTDADWVKHTVIGHQAELVSSNDRGDMIQIQDTLEDGVLVNHEIRATENEISFTITAHNPTKKQSEAHWAQPCIRLSRFTGSDQESYLKKAFVFLDGKPSMMPTHNWATKARYTPGQVWCPAGVNRNDVNPRPLNPSVPSNGLIGCYSADGSQVFGVAFEPYQELFQGVIVCLHSDFRLGGLQPGETKKIRGKIYIARDMNSLIKRYESDFPEHQSRKGR